MMKTLWKHNEDVRILKQSGVLERSRLSSESEDGSRPMRSRVEEANRPYQLIHNQPEESNSDEDDSIFDRDSLLRTGVTPKVVKQSGKGAVFPLVLILFTFFNLGLWLGIVGPTLPDLHANSNNHLFSSTVSVVTSGAVASIVGILLGAYLFQLTNVFFIIPVSLLFGGVITLIIPWVKGINGILVCFFLQGTLLGQVERGALNLFVGFWRRRATILHLFYLSLAIGGLVAPLLATPFVFSHIGHSSNVSVSLANGTFPARVRRASETNITASGWKSEMANETDAADNETTSAVVPTILTTTKLPKKPAAANGEGLPVLPEDKTFKQIKESERAKHDETAKPVATVANSTSTAGVTSTTTSSTTTMTTTTPTVPTTTTTTPVPTTTTTANSPAPMVVNNSFATFSHDGSTATWRDIWRHFLAEAQSNRSQMAYVIIAVVPMGVVLLMCCAVACRFGADMRNWQTPPPTHGGADGPTMDSVDGQFQYRSGRNSASAKDNYRTFGLVVAVLFFFLLSGMESAVYNLLTYYVAVGKGIVQSRGVELTSAFWTSVALSRLICVLIRSRVSSRVILTLCHVAMILISSIMFALSTTTVSALSTRMLSTTSISDNSWALLWFGFGGFGFAIGPVLPVSLAWLDERLRPSAMVLSMLVMAGHAGRAVVPISTAAGMVSYDPVSLVLCICVGSVFLTLLATVMYKLCRLAGELQVLTDLTKEVRGHNGDVAVYHQTNGRATEAKHAGAKEYPTADELLFDIGGGDDFDAADDFVHFELNRGGDKRAATDITHKVSDLADREGKFSNYFQKM